MEIMALSAWQWFWLIIAGLLIGFSKTGISGLLMPVIPVLAAVFGGRESTGIILPMLVVGDLFALYYYKQHGDWKDIKKLLPWAMVGLAAGVVVGNYINDRQFKTLIAISVLLCLVVLIYMENKKSDATVPKSKWLFILTGILSGFTSMIGNAAGPIFSVYLLAMGFGKYGYMGTTAWFFFVINLMKVPLQIAFWHNITASTALISGAMIPAIAIGAVLGSLILSRINEKVFRLLIMITTAAAAIRLLM